MRRLREIAEKPVRTVLGLMSGTSHDGVDAALARITGHGEYCRVELAGHTHRPYPPELRRRIAEAFDGPTALVCGLNFELGGFFAEAAEAALAEAGVPPGALDIVGSHGQTICHLPPGAPGRAGAGGTLQIGEGAVIARRTGAVTVTDFRTADIAAGGQGAPLVPYADWVLFRRPGEVTALQNIGGIANVTVVTERLGDVFGFDTGPGNSLMDWTVRLSSGDMGFDRGGELAKSGKIIPDLRAELMSHPFLEVKPPKSTGQEVFGRALVEDIIKHYPGAGLRDLLCTFAHFTADSIHRAYERFVFPSARPGRVLLAGGGANNGFLVSLIRGRFEGIPVGTTADFGVPAEAREALCFAVLADATVAGLPSNVPGVTGAACPAVLGKISLP